MPPPNKAKVGVNGGSKSTVQRQQRRKFKRTDIDKMARREGAKVKAKTEAENIAKQPPIQAKKLIKPVFLTPVPKHESNTQPPKQPKKLRPPVFLTPLIKPEGKKERMPLPDPIPVKEEIKKKRMPLPAPIRVKEEIKRKRMLLPSPIRVKDSQK